MWSFFVISMSLIFQCTLSQTCDTANWWGSLDKKGWSVCPKTNTYLKGFWRNDPSGSNGVWLLEEGKCCAASEPSYTNQPATCRNNVNWWATLDGSNTWALCPSGFFLEGIYISADSDPKLYHIEEAKCCRPQNHPDSYDGCYDEDVTISFDSKGWSQCQRNGYYMTGFYKSGCNEIYCIEKFRCCKMKKGTGVSCDTANWWGSLDKKGWSVCPKTNTYLKGFWRNDPSGSNGVWLLEEGKCCAASEPSYTNQPATCRNNVNWWATLDGSNTWALCPSGFYLEGIYISADSGPKLYHIEEAKCCRPQNHPDSYDGCYDEDVTISFDSKGWSQCQRDGYYMTGFYKSSCNEIYCIEKFRCCKMKKAVVNGGWSDWGDWGQCSATCGAGQQEHSRTCTNPPPSNGGAQCAGDDKETKPCNNGACPVNGGWSDFGDWGECSATCGDGEQERTRTCTSPPPSHGGAQCLGDDKEKRTCNNGPCPVNGGWSDFGKWSECSVTCGEGIRERTRTCTNPAPAHGGLDCVGDNNEKESCNMQACKVEKVNGGFTQWSEFSACSTTCGRGEQTSTRTCTNPPPSGGGRGCGKVTTRKKKCNLEPCKVSGGFTQWSEYSACSVTCGKGRQRRTRSCTNPPPSGGGRDCRGATEQTKKCILGKCEDLS